MKYSEAKQGRIFIMRLEDGDILHEEVERFAMEHGVQAAAVIALGGIDRDSILITGPEDGRTETITPMETVLENVHEATGTGTVFPDERGIPILHMHLASGRQGHTITGCVRRGVRIWHVLELIIFELVGSSASRKMDRATGFKLLTP
jgi:predicted DNA-binding protein with PD1-like motif